MINMVIVDDEEFFRDEMAFMVGTEENISVIATCATVDEALEVLWQSDIDVVLCDVRMPGKNGVEFMRLSRLVPSPPAVVAVTSFNDDVAMVDMLTAGARGFILKSAKRTEIMAAIHSAREGGTTISPSAASRLRQYIIPLEVAVEGLSALDTRVLRLLHLGKSNASIADEMNISGSSAKKSVARLMQTFDASSRLELVFLSRAYTPPGNPS